MEAFFQYIEDMDPDTDSEVQRMAKAAAVIFGITDPEDGGGILKIIYFFKKHYEIFVVNFIVLGFIAVTLLAQFGVNIRVDKDVELIPVEMQYDQSKKYIRSYSKSIYVTDCYVYLKYENDARKPFWAPASVVFGRAGEDEIKDMIEDGAPIKGNVFFNTKTNEVIGVTRSGKTVLSLYYRNSKLFRYGVWILILVDIFIGSIVRFINRRSMKKP